MVFVDVVALAGNCDGDDGDDDDDDGDGDVGDDESYIARVDRAFDL